MRAICFKIPKPPPPPVIPMKEDAAESRVRELQRRAGAKGFTSTISPGTLLGSSGQVPQSAATKTLLGG